jgi:hypothetical protein
MARKSCRLTLPSLFTSRIPVRRAPSPLGASGAFSVPELGAEDTSAPVVFEAGFSVVSVVPPLLDDISGEDPAVDAVVGWFGEVDSSAESLVVDRSVDVVLEDSSVDDPFVNEPVAASSVSTLLDGNPVDEVSVSASDSLSLDSSNGTSFSPEALAAPFLTPVPASRPAPSDDRLAVSTCTRADFSPADVGANRIRTICDPLELRSNGASPPTTVNSSASGPTIVRSVTSRGRLTGFSVVVPRVRAEPTATSPKSTVRARAGAVLATRPPVPAAATTVAPST